MVPALLCFTTAGRAWYGPGSLLVLAAAIGASDLRTEAAALTETISRNWLAALTAILAAFYVFLGATALGLAGVLGIVGGIAILLLVATPSERAPRVKRLVLVAATLPFAALTWWSVVTPLLAILVVAIGWPAPGGRCAALTVSREGLAR